MLENNNEHVTTLDFCHRCRDNSIKANATGRLGDPDLTSRLASTNFHMAVKRLALLDGLHAILIVQHKFTYKDNKADMSGISANQCNEMETHL